MREHRYSLSPRGRLIVPCPYLLRTPDGDRVLIGSPDCLSCQYNLRDRDLRPLNILCLFEDQVGSVDLLNIERTRGRGFEKVDGIPPITTPPNLEGKKSDFENLKYTAPRLRVSSVEVFMCKLLL